MLTVPVRRNGGMAKEKVSLPVVASCPLSRLAETFSYDQGDYGS